MAYRLVEGESVRDGVARIAREQIDKAIAEIEDSDLSQHEAVHQVRKRCKKIRGLIRLVRPALGKAYDEENAWYRDAAADLSGARDAQSVIAAYDQLVSHFGDQIDKEAFVPIRAELVRRRERITEDGTALKEKIDAFGERMREGRRRSDSWKLGETGFEAVAGGLLKTYDRARRALPEAYDCGTAESFHEWRKRVKYHWYHTRLLRSLWSPVLKGRRSESKRLADLLGNDHDLTVLHQTLIDQAADFGDEHTLDAVVVLIARRQAELRADAEPVGRRLFAENAKRFGKRFEEYWDAWQSEPNAGID